ncbi:MAG: T9SS type A sorting domain-containing protein [Flavobacteriales bacterium]|nr:T9SS type A sorting domain-containing protein [Flavobacteriales bacterium]
MKKYYLTFCLVTMSLMSYSQWQATNLTQFNYLAVSGTESFKGELYSTVFNGLGADFYQLDPGNASWTLKTISGVSGNPAALIAAGSNLYMTANSLGYSMLYRSGDASSFVADTVGLPKSMGGIDPAYGLQYFNGKVVVNLGSSGYWLKDTGATTWTHIDPPTALNAGTDPLCYSNDTLYAHDNSGANIFYVSGDYGQTWTARNTDLPSFFVGKILVSNQTTGRLYLAGAKSNGTLYGVYYSDNHGFNWTMANLSAFIGTDVNNGQQEVTAIYADGSTIYIALENDAANTTPDVISSASSISNMAYDTLGLVTDPAGTINGSRFISHNGNIAMALNVRDVYLHGSSTAVSEQPEQTRFSVWPVPAREMLHVTAEEAMLSVRITDLAGREVFQSKVNGNNTEIALGNLENGIYLVQAQFTDRLETTKIIKQ